MANTALKNFAELSKNTPQTKRTPGRKDEVKNNAGGYVFKVGDKERLERFLTIGTEGGTYYVGQEKLTEQNAKFLVKMIEKDEALVLKTIVDVSVNGRAHRQSPTLFALALVLIHGKDKKAVKANFNEVVRTGTHLFEFVNYINTMSGWGRAKRETVAAWYTEREVDSVAYQMVKYRSRSV